MCTQQKEQDSRGRGRTFPDSFYLLSNSGTTLEGLISPSVFFLLKDEDDSKILPHTESDINPDKATADCKIVTRQHKCKHQHVTECWSPMREF